MYLKNLLNITGRSPARMNDPSIVRSIYHTGEKLAKKGSRFSIAAFLLLSAILFSGCESSGTVGENLGPGDEEIEKNTFTLGGLNTISANTFSGRLQLSSMGYFEDPLYGSLRAVTLLKPSISRAQIDTIREGETLSLLLSLSSVVHGDETAVSEFEIFEAGQIWRGNELRYNSEIAVDFDSKVGEFQLTDEDSVEVVLDQTWVEKLRTFYDAPSEERDSLYVNEFPGLAIVPSATNQRIHYIRHSREEEDSPQVTRFLVYPAPTDEENGNGEGEDDETEPISLDLRDWGSSVTRTDEPVSSDGIVIHNIDRILKIDVELPKDQLKSRNITNANLILSLRKDVEAVFPGINRPEPGSIRGHSFSDEPSDLVSELFIRPSRFSGSLNEEDTFTIDITQYVLNEVFGESGEGPIYISLQAVNGIFYSTHIYDENAAENRRPRIIITSVE